jgi:two-component system, LytTR family, sensor kinase
MLDPTDGGGEPEAGGRPRLRYLLAIVVAGAALFSLDVLRARPDDRIAFVVALAFASALVKVLLWAGAGVAMWHLVRRVPLDGRPWQRTLGVHLAASLAVLAAVTLLGHVLQARLRLALLGALPASALDRLRDSWTGGPRLDLRASLAMALPWDLLTYWTILAGLAFWQGALRARERARRAHALGVQVNRAHLHALETQLQPHFLFNALHTISALLARDPTAARNITRRLRGLLGRLFQVDRRPVQPLRDELALLRDYLAIQEARFGDRLRVELAIEAGCEEALVPALLLQPLAENSVRHVAAHRAGPTRIRVAARREGDQLRLEVHDDGRDASDRPDRGTGIGLFNTRERLRQLHGEGQRFTFTPTAPPWGGALVQVAIPFDPAGQAKGRAPDADRPGTTAAATAVAPDRLWLLGWLLFGAAMLMLNLIWSSARYHVYGRAAGASWPEVLGQGSRGALAHVLLFPLVYAANRRLLPGLRTLSARLALHASLALALSFAKSALVRASTGLLGPAPVLSIVTLVGARIYSDVLHYALMAGLCHALERYRSARAQAARAARLEAELAGRLGDLRRRLEPEVLFDGLDRLEALVEPAPEQAERLIADLGDRLRQSLAGGGT